MDYMNNIFSDSESKKNELKNDAIAHIGEITMLKTMLSLEPDFAIKIELNNKSVFLCSTKNVLSLLDKEIREARKSLEGEINDFE